MKALFIALQIAIVPKKICYCTKVKFAIVPKKTNDQELKASPLSIYVKEKLNSLDKHRRTIDEKRTSDVLFDAQISNEIENTSYAVNGLHLLLGNPNKASQNMQN